MNYLELLEQNETLGITKKLIKLVKKRETLNQEIELEIGKLPNINNECHCNQGDLERDEVDFIHYGSHFNEIFVYCLICGGFRERGEH